MISLYAAYTDPPGAMCPLRVHESLVKTAGQAKKLMGLDSRAWLYLKLPRHERDKKCSCFYCAKAHKWITRPMWVPEGENWLPHVTQVWPWSRVDIGSKNARLNLSDGCGLVGVALHDMPSFNLEFQAKGRNGMLWALEWILSEDKKKLEAEDDS